MAPAVSARKPRRRARAVVLGALLRGLSSALGVLPWRVAQRFGRGVGTLGWAFSRRDKRRALEHLAIAFPEASEGERRRLGRASFRHLGETLAETLYLMRHDCEELGRRVHIEGWDHVERARAAGRPLLIVTGHCGNWELLAAVISCRGLGMAVVARQLDEPEFDALLVGLRRRFGTTTIARGAPGAARHLLRALRAGGCLGILIDQDTKVDGVWVPFLGRPAYTPVGAADLVRRLDAIPLPTFVERLADGSHLVRFHSPPELPGDPVAATAALSRAIEDQIRRRPEQWVWFHRRWRRQPPEVVS
jgi:KDO2-lipid IV(A) lauroyltransferase